MKTKPATIKKTVLITGAGRGLGRAIAKAYYQAGFQVFATDINSDLLSDLDGRDGFVTFCLDVTSEHDVSVCASKVEKLTARVDVIVSNAGVFDFYPVCEAGSRKLNKLFEVNVMGLANLAKYFGPQLIHSKGRLIVISSESYKVPSPFQPYAVSKQALESVFKAIKIEFSLKGIQSVLIRPGAMQTQILDDTVNFMNFEDNSSFKKEFRNFIESVPKYIGKISTPEDVARVVLKAGTSKSQKSVYSINHNPLVTVLSLLPEKLKNLVIRNSLKPG